MSLLASRTRLVRLTIALCATVAIGAPAVAKAQAVTQAGGISDAPKPFEALSNSAVSMRDSIVAMARAQIGTKYRHGGTSPKKGFDCSGLIQYVMSAFNLSVPRTAKQQAVTGLAVNKDTSRLLPGDLLTFGKGKKGQISHVGIYVGDGKYIHASSVAGRVVESKIDRPASPLIKIWKGARRVLSLDDSVQTTSVATTKGGGGY
jgi:cell wall-associated NlpC family hydrolase